MSRGGSSPDGRKVKGTLHWVSAEHAQRAQIRLYNTLFLKENPGLVKDGEDFTDYLNPNSLKVLADSWVEPSLAQARPGASFQFMRQGYFAVDIKDTSEDNLIFNRTVTLRDTWAKIQKAK